MSPGWLVTRLNREFTHSFTHLPIRSFYSLGNSLTHLLIHSLVHLHTHEEYLFLLMQVAYTNKVFIIIVKAPLYNSDWLSINTYHRFILINGIFKTTRLSWRILAYVTFVFTSPAEFLLLLLSLCQQMSYSVFICFIGTSLNHLPRSISAQLLQYHVVRRRCATRSYCLSDMFLEL